MGADIGAKNSSYRCHAYGCYRCPVQDFCNLPHSRLISTNSSVRHSRESVYSANGLRSPSKPIGAWTKGTLSYVVRGLCDKVVTRSFLEYPGAACPATFLLSHYPTQQYTRSWGESSARR